MAKVKREPEPTGLELAVGRSVAAAFEGAIKQHAANALSEFHDKILETLRRWSVDKERLRYEVVDQLRKDVDGAVQRLAGNIMPTVADGLLKNHEFIKALAVELNQLQVKGS